MRVAEEDADVCGNGELRMAGHLFALIPGECFSQLWGKPNHFTYEGATHLLGTTAIGQMHEQEIATSPFDKSRDGRLSAFANDQIAFPMPWDSTVLGLGRTVTDHHHVGQLTLPLRSSTGTPPGTACS